jgi:acetyl esterase/lipase
MAGFDRLQRFMSVRMAFDGQMTGDGRVIYMSTLLGVPSPWVADGSRTGPEPLILDDARTSAVALSPSQPWAILSQDEGGNERHQLVAVSLNERVRRPLTHRLDSIHRFGAFFPDGRQFVVTTNRRNGVDFDVFLGSLDRDELEEVPILGGPLRGIWSAPAVFPDGRSVLLQETLSPSVHHLYRLDLDVRPARLTRLTPESPASWAAAAVQGEQVLAVSNLDHEFSRLVAISPAGRITVLADVDADVEAFAAHPTGALAYVVNRDGWSELFVRRNPGAPSQQVTLPAGVIATVRWNPAGNVLIFDQQTPQAPFDVYTWDASSTTVRPVTRSYRAGLQPDDLIIPDLVSVESFDGLKVRCWYYRPRTDGPWPAVIAVHGGPEGQARPIFSALYQYWLSLGIAVLAPNIRGSTGYGRTYEHLDDVERRIDAIRDLEAVTRWLRTQPDVDAERIVLYGGSYGGYMVLAGLTWFPDLYRAGVELVGIVNLETFLERTSPWRRAFREAEYGSLARDRETLRALSPIHRIDRLRAPLFVGHGKNDPRVPFAEAVQVVEALRARGVPHVLFPMDDEGHGAVRLANQRRLYGAIQAFLVEHAGFPGE